jgi:hypothetical protein
MAIAVGIKANSKFTGSLKIILNASGIDFKM